MKVFVTGATGLVGSHTAERLRGAGHEVVALCRRGADTEYLATLGCAVVEGDLRDPPAVHARRLDGCDALLHAAAYIYGGPDLESVRDVNVIGTRALLKGAADAGVDQTVHISSVAVYGDPPAPITEDTGLEAPLRPVDFYGRSKREAEAVVAELRERRGLPVTTLRPPAIYGERDRLFVPKLVGFLRRPVTFLLGAGDTQLAAVYAGNVAEAVVRALEGQGRGGTFNVTVDVPVTQRTLYGGLSRAMGLKSRLLAIPAGPARLGARIGDALGIRVPGAEDLSLTRSVRLATNDNPYVSDRARDILGWRPPFTLDEALERTGAWARGL